MADKDKRMRIRKRIFRIMPWAVGLTLVLMVLIPFAFARDTEIAAEELAAYAPKNEWLAVAFLIVLFAVKSLIFVIPIPLLYICSGLIFKPVTAFLVNVLGMIACTTLPYWIGRYSGGGIVKKLLKRFPKMRLLDTFKSDNEWFFSFIVRVIGFLPCDAVSMILGACKVDFRKYVAGTAVGMLPGLISTTLVGITITDPHSPEFLFSCILTAVVSIASIVFYRIYLKLRVARPSHPLFSHSTLSAGVDPQQEQQERDHIDDQQ